MRTRIFTRYVNVRLQKKRAGAWIPLQACQCPLLFREPPLATFSHPASQRWMTRKTPCRGTTSLCRDLYLRSLATLARGHLKDIHDVWLVSGAAWAKLKSLRWNWKCRTCFCPISMLQMSKRSCPGNKCNILQLCYNNPAEP